MPATAGRQLSRSPASRQPLRRPATALRARRIIFRWRSRRNQFQPQLQVFERGDFLHSELCHEKEPRYATIRGSRYPAGSSAFSGLPVAGATHPTALAIAARLPAHTRVESGPWRDECNGERPTACLTTEHPTSLPRSAEFLNDEPETIEPERQRGIHLAIVDERLMPHIRPASRVTAGEHRYIYSAGRLPAQRLFPYPPGSPPLVPLRQSSLSLSRTPLRSEGK
jgi:hypothetical protein